MIRWRKQLDFFAALNGVLLVIALAGAVVMTYAFGLAVVGVIKDHSLLNLKTTPSATSTESPRTSIPALKEVTRTYAFTKAKDLKAFKKTGFGTVDITPGHRLRLRANAPAAVSASLTVGVDGGSTVRFDDEHSGNPGYDVASFAIDGVVQASSSGTGGGSAKYQIYPLSHGKHTLTWQYSTDSTFNLPTDAYYVDNIRITKVIVSPGWL